MSVELLGQTAAQIMETIEEDELPEGWQLAEVLVVAAVKWPVPDAQDEEEGETVYFRCSSAYPWVQRGLLQQAARAMDTASRPWPPEDE